MLRAAVVNNWNLDGGIQQRSAATVRRGHRHGLSMGISLAEALILLLLLLLLVLGVRMVHVQKQAHDAQGAYEALQASIPALKPFLENLPQEHQLRAPEVQEFLVKLSRVIELEKARATLARENSDLRSRLAAKSPDPEPAAKSPVPEPQEARALSVDLDRRGDESPAKAALVEGERAPLHDRAAKVTANVANNFSPNEAMAPRAESLSRSVAGPRRTQPRPGCSNRDFLRAHVGRPSGQISAWCP